jgi:DNA (cytosine-5)-methyltransferase 1
MLLSLFCGPGGLDLGFETAAFEVGLALDKNADSVASYNLNRQGSATAQIFDLASITAADIDRLYGSAFHPTGVIGGPPCQSFSQANVNQRSDDERSRLPMVFAEVVEELHSRSPIDFFVMENVVGLTRQKHLPKLEAVEKVFARSGFKFRRLLLNASDYGVPQKRPRLFLVGVDAERFASIDLAALAPITKAKLTVRDVIQGLPEPTHFSRLASTNPHHPNHWCMTPKSPKFSRPGGVSPGVAGRSFKTLSWDEPSITVAYGHREVHVHPGGRRRLSVYEAMLLQGFPKEYRLLGTLSSQIDQVSEAVPPPLAQAVAEAVRTLLGLEQADKAA